MHTYWKRGLALGLGLALAFSALTGCSKKEKSTEDASMLTLEDGGTISQGTANLLLRYQQAEFESGLGAFLRSYYGDIWNSDLTGSGQAYGSVFKEQIQEDMVHMLLAEAHQADYNIELSAEEKSAITDAAKAFIEANPEDVLAKMGGTQENAERMLTLYTIRQKVENEIGSTVDTEVSDEEAAQRTVSYVFYSASVETEAEEEAVTEGAGLEEAVSEAFDDAAEAVSEAAADAAEMVSEAAADVEEAVSEAAAEVEEGISEAAEQAELAMETEIKTGEADEAATEGVTESAGEAAAEEAEPETEGETESAEMTAAREEALAKAEALLARAMAGEDFEALAEEAVEADDKADHSSYTFGDGDSYPDQAIIEATAGLEDGAVVDHVVVVGTNYYVLHVDDAFDEDATEEKKEEIVNQRKQDAVSEVFEGWEESAQFKLDQDAWGALAFNLLFSREVEDVESISEAVTEAWEEISEGAESVAEAATE